MDALGDWIGSGRLIELILLLVAFEALALSLLHRLTGKGIAPRELIGLLAAGVCLLLALRAALTDSGWMQVGLWLTLALAAHLADLAMRWRP